MVVFARQPRASADEAKLPAGIEEALEWLPPDTETLIVAQGPFAVPPMLPDELDLVRLVQAQACGFLMIVKDQFFRERLEKEQVLLAVEGSREFRVAKDLGLGPFEGCEIVRFEEGAHAIVRKAFRDFAEKAESKLLLAGTKVVVIEQRLESDDWTFYVALPQDGLLLCATDRGYLEVVLQRMKAGGKERALPESLPEWKHVNVKAPAWGLRHYCKETAADDPTSLLGDGLAPDPKAIGLTVSLEHEAKSARLRYLSESPDIKERWAKFRDKAAEGVGPTFDVSSVAPNVVEIRINFEEDFVATVYLFVLVYLGHSVSL